MGADTLALWVIFATCVTGVCVLSFFTVIYYLRKLGVAMSETQDRIDAVTAKLEKVDGEVVASRDALTAEIRSLRDQLANIPGAEVVDLSGLESVAQQLDDLNADPVVEPPVEEPPVEAPVEDQPA